MNRITFLDNAYQGKNNWWRYVLTTLITWGVGLILTIIFLMLISVIIYPFTGVNILSETFSSPTNSLSSLIFLGIYYTIVFLLFYLCIRFIHHKKLIGLVNTSSKFNWMKILKGSALWFSILGFILLLNYMIDPTGINVSFNQDTFLLLILCLIIFPIQASLEEIFFRGYLMQGFGLLTKMPVIPLIITSIIFALLHFFNGADETAGIVIVIQMFIFGTTLGIITLGENRLETAMGIHIAYNIFILSILGSSEDMFNGLPSMLTLQPDSIGIPFFIPILILLTIIFWGKRSNLSRIFKNQGKIERFKPKSSFKYINSQDKKIQCFNCNTFNPIKSNYCRKCGVKIKNPQYIENNPTISENCCLNCYTLNPKEAVYCRQCGTKMLNKSPFNSLKDMKCITCHTVNPNEAIYCKYCGTKI